MKLFLFINNLLLTLLIYSQGGKVIDLLTLESQILNSKRKYAIYLPPDYESSKRHYPVLYLLHGAGDDQTGWIQFGEVLQIADNTISSGQATAMIIVMPDAQTGKKGYFNNIEKTWNYEDFFFQEFIPFIETKYRIKPEKRFRAIAGLSMGGAGSFIYALRYPKYFSSCCPLSASLEPLNFDEFYKKDVNSRFRRDVAYNYFSNHNALFLIKNQTEKELKSVNWYIDCGDDDFLYEGNSLVHIALKKRQIAHEYRVRDGGHNWSYWRSALPRVLEFVSTTFHQN